MNAFAKAAKLIGDRGYPAEIVERSTPPATSSLLGISSVGWRGKTAQGSGLRKDAKTLVLLE